MIQAKQRGSGKKVMHDMAWVGDMKEKNGHVIAWLVINQEQYLSLSLFTFFFVSYIEGGWQVQLYLPPSPSSHTMLKPY